MPDNPESIQPKSYFFVIALANMAWRTYFLFSHKVLVAIMPFSKRSRNNGMDVKK
jgi:hypothetical protein